jgi:hypothetical protein
MGTRTSASDVACAASPPDPAGHSLLGCSAELVRSLPGQNARLIRELTRWVHAIAIRRQAGGTAEAVANAPLVLQVYVRGGRIVKTGGYVPVILVDAVRVRVLLLVAAGYSTPLLGRLGDVLLMRRPWMVLVADPIPVAHILLGYRLWRRTASA